MIDREIIATIEIRKAINGMKTGKQEIRITGKQDE